MNFINKVILNLIIISLILLSGCVSTKAPVDSEDVMVDISPIKIKEYSEQQISLAISNKANEPIDNVKVTSFGSFSVLESSSVNIPGMKDELKPVSIAVKILAPSFDSDEEQMLTLSYSSGKDEKGNPVLKTKNIPVETTILPNANLQFLGFVKGMENISEAEVTTWTIARGENATITFSVKNEGRTTIDENTMDVLIEVDNKRIGSSKKITIKEPMARAGTSYTKGVEVPILENAPNGETDVVVTLLKGDEILDSRTLLLIVKL
jgi:hypothetical protein